MANPKASDVAIELRRIADALDKEPDTEVKSPMLTFYCNSYSAKDRGKLVFLNVVRLLPRPLAKWYGENQVEVENPNKDTVRLRACIDRVAVCEIVEPAKPAVYYCTPLLSDQEEAELPEF
jgi:hypothetical protein